MPLSSLCQAVLGLPITPRLPLPLFWGGGWGPRIPSGPLCAVLSSTVLGMGPLPVGIAIAFSFFPSFLHSKVEFTLQVFKRGTCGTQISSQGLCLGSGWRSVHLRSSTLQRLASEHEWNASSERTERLLICGATAVFPMSIWKATKCQFFCHSTCSHTL